MLVNLWKISHAKPCKKASQEKIFWVFTGYVTPEKHWICGEEKNNCDIACIG